MKIQIRRSSPSPKTGPIKVREKSIYNCKECSNRYYSYYFFCPQCLGEVVSSSRHTAVLQIISCGDEQDVAADLLKKLSENQQFDFEKALQSVPWLCMLNTDPAILQHWKECLEAQKIQTEILSEPPQQKKRKRKQQPPLFVSNAPFPAFFTSSVSQALRATARSVPLASAKLRWAETVLLSFTILDGLYKNHTGRILFYDFICKIEDEFREFMESFGSRKWSETEFLKRNEMLKASFERMEAEIQAVRQQVQERL